MSWWQSSLALRGNQYDLCAPFLSESNLSPQWLQTEHAGHPGSEFPAESHDKPQVVPLRSVTVTIRPWAFNTVPYERRVQFKVADHVVGQRRLSVVVGV
jgi:hypothetical protein